MTAVATPELDFRNNYLGNVSVVNGVQGGDGSDLMSHFRQGFGGGMGTRRGFDPYLYRPFLDAYDRPCVIVNTGQWTVEKGERLPIRRKKTISDAINGGFINFIPVFNATSLRKEEWQLVDRAVVKAARLRLNLWNDLAGVETFGGFNGMQRLTLEYEAMSDPGEAIVDMEAITPGRTDHPLFKLRSLPLPITHSDFFFSQRRIEVSGNMGPSVDTTQGEAAARRVSESIEKQTIGTETGATYGTQSTGITAHDGTSTVYGLTNLPARITKTDLNTPTGTNPEAVLADVLEMIELMEAQGFFGPYFLYHSTGYTRYLNDDYFRTGSTSAVRSLRMRLMETGLQKIQRLDYLTSGYQLLLVQIQEFGRAVIGMPITTIQWPTVGGMMQNFKVMTISVPHWRFQYNGIAQVVHGTTS